MDTLTPMLKAQLELHWCRDHFHGDVDLDTIAARLDRGLVYLATPYSQEVVDGEGRFQIGRSQIAMDSAAFWQGALALRKVTTVSPIVQSAHMIHVLWAMDAGYDLRPLEHAFWTAWCEPMLDACDAVVVPPIPGRARSRVIMEEIGHALDVAKVPVFWLAEDAA